MSEQAVFNATYAALIAAESRINAVRAALVGLAEWGTDRFDTDADRQIIAERLLDGVCNALKILND